MVILSALVFDEMQFWSLLVASFASSIVCLVTMVLTKKVVEAKDDEIERLYTINQDLRNMLNSK